MDATSAQDEFQLEMFVEEIQGEIAPRREVFLPVIKAYNAFKKVRFVYDSTPAKAIVEKLAEALPTADDGASIKRALLKSPLHLEHLGFRVFEEQLLQSLCLTTKADAFSAGELEIATRAKRLWQSEHPSALKFANDLIGSSSLNLMGESFLDGVCDAITPAEVAQLSAKRQLAAEAFVRRRPELATHTAIWQCTSNVQRGMFQALVRSEADQDPFEGD